MIPASVNRSVAGALRRSVRPLIRSDPSDESDTARACRRSCPRRCAHAALGAACGHGSMPARMAPRDIGVASGRRSRFPARASVSRRQLAVRRAPRERRAERIVGRRGQRCVLAPTFEPERTTPPGNGMITSATRASRRRRLRAARAPASVSRAEQQQVAAADGLDHRCAVFPRRRTRRPSPARASSARRRSSSRSASRRRRSAGPSPSAIDFARFEARNSRRGVGQVSTHWPTRRSTCFASSLPDIAKISIAHARPAVRRFVGREISRSMPPRSRSRSRRSRSRSQRSPRCAPIRRVGGDDDARRLHGEGFGEGVVDRDAVDASCVMPRAAPGRMRSDGSEPPAAACADLVILQRRKFSHAHRRDNAVEVVASKILDARDRRSAGRDVSVPPLTTWHDAAVARDQFAVLEQILGRREHRSRSALSR